jgi:hypothetical protein
MTNGTLTDEYIAQCEMDARRLGPANCWTGTSGSVAAHVMRLIEDRKQTQGGKMPGTAADMLEQTAATVRQRQATYGPPREHFARTVSAINAIFAYKLREPLTMADWAQIMILDKLARHQGPNKSDDTPLDMAGYAGCLYEVSRE